MSEYKADDKNIQLDTLAQNISKKAQIFDIPSLSNAEVLHKAFKVDINDESLKHILSMKEQISNMIEKSKMSKD